MKIVPRWLTALTVAFAIVAACLWVLAAFSTAPTLFPAGPGFVDIAVYKGRFVLYHTAKFFTSRAYSGFAYPAGAAPIYQAFYSTHDAILTYWIAAAVITFVALLAAFLFLKRRGATALLLPLCITLSFPLIFLIQRANIELFLWLLTGVGIIAYRRGLRVVAAVLFGIAAAIKLYPILLLGLFLKRRKDLAAFIVGIASAVLATSAAIVYTGPTFIIAARGFFTGVDRFQKHYVDVVSKVEIAFDHCFFSPFKAYAYTHHASPAPWKTAYLLIAGLLTLMLFMRVRTLPFLNRIVFLVAAMISLPPVSFAYTLVHLYVPLFLLVGAMLTFRRRPPVTAILALIVLLFLTLPIMSFSVFSPGLATGPLQSFALLALLLLCAAQPWPEADVRANA